MKSFTNSHAEFMAVFILVSFIIGMNLGSRIVPRETIIQEFHCPDAIIMEETVEYRCENDPDCMSMAEAIYYEARNQSFIGQVAIGHTIKNRADRWYFPDTIKEVVEDRCQFSYRCDGSLEDNFSNKNSYDLAKLIAEGIILGKLGDPTRGADHYLNPKTVKRIPSWTKAYPRTVIIGSHHFHKRGKR